MPGIYIHIPFCKQACHYCNFHFTTSLRYKDELIAALVKEILITPVYSTQPNEIISGGHQGSKETIHTLYFGGGSPSILPVSDLVVLIDAIRSKFDLAKDIEITLEANPDDISPAQLEQWLSIGINRLSIGLQSFNEEELRWMNRAHTATDAIRCLQEIRAAGFVNYSADLIYGSPLLSDEQWKRHVQILTDSKVPHISCYALTVEPNTSLHKMIRDQKRAAVDAEKQAGQFLLLMDWMEAAGYEHYEISNFALPGLRSKHNSSYWLHEKGDTNSLYYGFGPAAHAYDGHTRRWNVANNSVYIQSLKNNQLPFEEEILTPTQQLNEYIMTSLRTSEGLDLQYVAINFGQPIADKLLQKIRKWESGGKVNSFEAKRLLTKNGKLFADGIAADLFF